MAVHKLKIKMSDKQMVENISKKLGTSNFEELMPKYTEGDKYLHDDSKESPFSCLTLDELLFLREHGYKLPNIS